MPFREAWREAQETGEVRLTSPIEVMRFTLTYRGRLHAASASDTKASEKHEIRRYLHDQLLDLWRLRPVLRREFEQWMAAGSPEARQAWEDQLSPLEEPAHVLQSFPCGPLRFIPLITRRLDLICELDILFLRAEPPGKLFGTNEAGDLDNRLKVFFDALRVPRDVGELPRRLDPDEYQRPTFCLLENDNLITALRVESERLLDASDQRKGEVELVVRVTVKSERISWHNLDLIG